jgi:hypothetical protein
MRQHAGSSRGGGKEARRRLLPCPRPATLR